MGSETAPAHDILERLTVVLGERRQADPDASYVASLYDKGLDVILKKLGEEAIETVIAAKDGDRQALVHELADLWFHSLVLMVHQDVSPDDVLGELTRRFGMSGIQEKAQRLGSKS